MTFMIVEFIQYFLQAICFSKCKFFINSLLGFSSTNSKIQTEKKNQDSTLSKSVPSFAYRGVHKDEVEQVMGNLGIFCHFNGEKLPERLNSDDMFNMFEEEQPRLDEVKGAFDVFDENKDEFIDEKELQRVLFALGMKDRSSMDDCKRMIRLFDDNDDGRIDFDEFVKFMEETFC